MFMHEWSGALSSSGRGISALPMATRFIISVRDFKEMTGPKAKASPSKRPKVMTVLTAVAVVALALLVSEPDTHGQVDAGLFG